MSLATGAHALLPAATSGLPPWAIGLIVAVCVIPASIAAGFLAYRARHGKPGDRPSSDRAVGKEEHR